MKSTTMWAVLRWLTAAALIVYAFLALNYTLFSIMATVAPPTNEYHEAWAFEVYAWTGYSAALLCAAALAAINLRPNFPYLKSKWNVLFVVIALIAIAWPRAHHFLEVDRCLDAGGSWNDTSQRCARQ